MYNLLFFKDKNVDKIDKILLKTRLPIESSRSTRSIKERHLYKANEWRNICFYLVIPMFKNNLNAVYFNNLLKYVIFLRILCQDKISPNDLIDAKAILCDFIFEFELLYGKDLMSSNLHGHFHLVKQVERFGPLIKISCFAFENMFKISRDMYHGTVNPEGQISRNLIRNQTIQLEAKNLQENTMNHDIKAYMNKYNSLHLNQNTLYSPEKKSISNFNQIESDLIKGSFGNLISHINSSNRALINNKSKIFF
jgi:hypothetical protein